MNSATNQPRKKFSPEEDTQLRQMVEKYGIKAWGKISELLPGRTPRQCRERYGNYLQPHLVNGEWSQEEEQQLIEKYHEIGPKWTKIASFFDTRSDVNVKNHWSAMKRRGLITIDSHPQIQLDPQNQSIAIDTPNDEYWIPPNETPDIPFEFPLF